MLESTGDIVFVGKVKEDDEPALHVYKYKNGWQKIRTIPFPCSHQEWFYILTVMIENSERLLVSCCDCEVVWFCDIDSGTFNEALRKEEFKPGPMCKAEGYFIYCINNVKGSNDILKVKCSLTGLTVDKGKTIHRKMEKLHSMCYLPDVKCIAISSWPDHLVKAIHCEDK